jgi:hypothetical protein
LLFLQKKLLIQFFLINFNENMSFLILNRGKKSSKFWQVIVNYGRFIGFKDQLGFFEFCYELALANQAKKKNLETNVRPFLKKIAFFGQNTKFSSSM